MITETTGQSYSFNYLYKFLRTEYGAKFSKPYPRDYRQNPYYKQSFNLKILAKLNRYNLVYNPKTNTIKNIKKNEPFLIFSYDESSNQFKTNNSKLWSLTKPLIEKVTDTLKCKVTGSYSLTNDGKDDLHFMENSKKETIVKCLESLQKKNPIGTILLLIDNFPSHKSTLVKEKAKRTQYPIMLFTTILPTITTNRTHMERYKKSHIPIQNQQY